jgi:hypothetical protein
MNERKPGHPFEWEKPWPLPRPTPENRPDMFVQAKGPQFDVQLVASAWIARKNFARGLPKGTNGKTAQALRAVLYTDELNRYRKLVGVIGFDGWDLVKKAVMGWGGRSTIPDYMRVEAPAPAVAMRCTCGAVLPKGWELRAPGRPGCWCLCPKCEAVKEAECEEWP